MLAVAVVLLALCASMADGGQLVLDAVADTTIFSEDDTSSGLGPDLYFGVTAGGDERRALLFFNASGQLRAVRPQLINSALLSVYVNREHVRAANVYYDVHALRRRFAEAASESWDGVGVPAQPGDATWTYSRYDTETWHNPGGDFAAAATVSQLVGAIDAVTTFDVSEDVRRWLFDAGSAECGWLIKVHDTKTRSTAKRIGSRQAAYESQRPQLTIHFT